MKALVRNRSVFILALFAVVALGVLFLSGAQSGSLTQTARASGTPGLTGYAWSPNIGWINFNTGANQVTLSGSNLVGYAWSQNIGWIKFGGLAGFPAGGGTTASNAQITSGQIRGWARACAGTSVNDCTGTDDAGWDGWIALSGTGYAPTITGSTIAGYAWGSNVVGWIDFSQVVYSANPPACTSFTTSTPTITVGSNASFAYTTVNTTSLTRSVDGGANVVVASSPFTISGLAVGSHDVTLDLTNSADGSTGTCGPVTVTVTAQPVPVVTISATPPNGQVNVVNPDITWSSTNSPTSCSASGDWSGLKAVTAGNHTESQVVLTSIRIYTYILQCTNGGGSDTKSATVDVTAAAPPPPPAIGNFYPDPSRVRYASSTTLYWTISNFVANTCHITANPSTGISPASYTVTTASGSKTTQGIQQRTEFTLDCGSGSSQVKTVTLVPSVIEI